MINLDLSKRQDAKRSLSLSIPFRDYVYLEELAKNQGLSINRLVKMAIQETLKRKVAGSEIPKI
mgnify:CR=1